MDNHAKTQSAVTELEAEAIAFVRAVVKTNAEHPTWLPLEDYFDPREDRAWRRLKRAIRTADYEV